jgi:hypothetical protein
LIAVVSGSLGDTARVWDLATEQPVGFPFTDAGGVVAVLPS